MAPGTCRVCGCTENDPLPGGCFWVEADLCSACAEDMGQADEFVGDIPDHQCPAGTPAPHKVFWTTETQGHCVRCRMIVHA